MVWWLMLSGCWLTADEIDKPLPFGNGPAEDTPGSDTPDADTPDADTDRPSGDTFTLLDPAEIAACADEPLPRDGDHYGWRGSLANEGDDVGIPCSPGDQNDLVFDFRAPSAGCWVFTTQGSRGDTALTARASCGEPGVCNDDADPLYLFRHAEIHRVMSKDDPLLITIDTLPDEPEVGVVLTGYRGEEVPWDTDLGRSANVEWFDTLPPGAGTRIPETNHRDCGTGSGERDRLYRWTAPRAGTWAFTVETEFRSVLSLLRACTTDIVTCSDEGLTFSGEDAESLTIQAAAGETFIIRVAAESLPGPGPTSGDINLAIFAF
jgi:hypothetical protein